MTQSQTCVNDRVVLCATSLLVEKRQFPETFYMTRRKIDQGHNASSDDNVGFQLNSILLTPRCPHISMALMNYFF